MPSNQAYSYMETYAVWHNTDTALSGNWPSAFPALDNPLTVSERAFDAGLYYLQWMFIDDVDGGEVNFVSEPVPYAANGWAMGLEGERGRPKPPRGAAPPRLRLCSPLTATTRAVQGSMILYHEYGNLWAKYRIFGWFPGHSVMISQTIESNAPDYDSFLDRYFVMTWHDLEGTGAGDTVYLKTYGDYGPDGVQNTADDVFYTYGSLEEAAAAASDPGAVWSDDLLTHR